MEVELGDDGPTLTDWSQVTVFLRGGGEITLLSETEAANNFCRMCITDRQLHTHATLQGVRATPLVLKTSIAVKCDQVTAIDVQEAPSIVYNAAQPGSLEEVAATGLISKK